MYGGVIKRMDDRTGQWLWGRYRLERRVATDRTGDRYAAWDGAALLDVAVLIIAPAMLEPAPVVADYERQAARLRTAPSRGTIGVRALHRDGDTVFLVLESPPALTLRALLQERDAPFRPAAAAQLLGPVADALDALHAAGIAHRHVTPETIAIASDGSGILLEPAFVPPGADAAAFGPSTYLSPEQVRGGAVEGATDIYALGAILAEMLRGPRAADNAVPDHPRRLPHWQPIVDRALDQDAAARPRSAAAMVVALADPTSDPRAASAFMAGAEGTKALHDLAAGRVVSGPSAATRAVALSPDADSSPTDDDERTGMVFLPDGGEGYAAMRRRRPLVSALAVLTTLVLLSAVVLGGLVFRRVNTLTAQEHHYAAAQVALAQGEYDAAIDEFTAAGTYRDAPARADAARVQKDAQANYDAGAAAFDRADYAGAADAFGRAGTYRDAPQRRVTALRLVDQQQAYADGQAALAKEDYTTAATAFARAGDYQDAAQRAAQAQTLIGQQRQYQTGKDAFLREDYSTASAAFRAAGNYQDAAQQAARAEQLRDQKAAYDAGDAAFAREEYKAAKQQFLMAGDYKDAAARAAQSDQEAALLAKYTSAQDHLRASQWKDAYADLQDIRQSRPDYKDVGAIIAHLENDVVNPTTVDVFSVLNQLNGYKEAWVPVNNLIGQPVTWLYVAARQPTVNGRPDALGAVTVSLVAKQGSKESLNAAIPLLAANGDLKNALRSGENLFVVTGKGQTFEVADFGKYRARLSVTNVGFPGGGGATSTVVSASATPSANDTTGATNPFFSRLVVDVTLIPRSP